MRWLMFLASRSLTRGRRLGSAQEYPTPARYPNANLTVPGKLLDHHRRRGVVVSSDVDGRMLGWQGARGLDCGQKQY